MNLPDMHDVEGFIRASNGVLTIYKSLASLFPKGQLRDDAVKRLVEAERALQAAEVQLARSLGYPLCKCTFPPQIMAQTGRHPDWEDLMFKCGKCGDQYPTEGYFRGRDQAKLRSDAENLLMRRI